MQKDHKSEQNPSPAVVYQTTPIARILPKFIYPPLGFGIFLDPFINLLHLLAISDLLCIHSLRYYYWKGKESSLRSVRDSGIIPSSRVTTNTLAS